MFPRTRVPIPRMPPKTSQRTQVLRFGGVTSPSLGGDGAGAQAQARSAASMAITPRNSLSSAVS